MKFSQGITRVSVAAVALLNLSIATSAFAETITVTRGPNGAAHVVKADKVPLDAQVAPMTEARSFPELTLKGPGGAAHITTQEKPSEFKAEAARPKLVRQGTHGAFFVSNQ